MSHELRLLLVIATLFASSCSAAVPEARVPAEMVFFDVETKQPVVQPVSAETPAVNAATGRRTLLPGLYCRQCREWRPAPPLEVAQRMPAALRCPQCQAAMTADGPVPE
jgi:hypothetical protein